MVNRLDPVVVAIERQDNPVIIVSHQVCMTLRTCILFVFVKSRGGFPSDLRVFITAGRGGVMTCPNGGCPREASQSGHLFSSCTVLVLLESRRVS